PGPPGARSVGSGGIRGPRGSAPVGRGRPSRCPAAGRAGRGGRQGTAGAPRRSAPGPTGRCPGRAAWPAPPGPPPPPLGGRRVALGGGRPAGRPVTAAVGKRLTTRQAVAPRQPGRLVGPPRRLREAGGRPPP